MIATTMSHIQIHCKVVGRIREIHTLYCGSISKEMFRATAAAGHSVTPTTNYKWTIERVIIYHPSLVFMFLKCERNHRLSETSPVCTKRTSADSTQ